MIFTVLLLMMVTSRSEKIPSNVYIPRSYSFYMGEKIYETNEFEQIWCQLIE